MHRCRRAVALELVLWPQVCWGKLWGGVLLKLRREEELAEDVGRMWGPVCFATHGACGIDAASIIAGCFCNPALEVKLSTLCRTAKCEN